jgi:hypothetical protein
LGTSILESHHPTFFKDSKQNEKFHPCFEYFPSKLHLHTILFHLSSFGTQETITHLMKET